LLSRSRSINILNVACVFEDSTRKMSCFFYGLGNSSMIVVNFKLDELRLHAKHIPDTRYVLRFVVFHDGFPVSKDVIREPA